jgi:hypothetical protein
MCLTGRAFHASVLERTPAVAAGAAAAPGGGTSLTSLFSSGGKSGDTADASQIGGLKVERRVEQPGSGTEGVGQGKRGDWCVHWGI